MTVTQQWVEKIASELSNVAHGLENATREVATVSEGVEKLQGAVARVVRSRKETLENSINSFETIKAMVRTQAGEFEAKIGDGNARIQAVLDEMSAGQLLEID